MGQVGCGTTEKKKSWLANVYGQLSWMSVSRANSLDGKSGREDRRKKKKKTALHVVTNPKRRSRAEFPNIRRKLRR